MQFKSITELKLAIEFHHSVLFDSGDCKLAQSLGHCRTE